MFWHRGDRRVWGLDGEEDRKARGSEGATIEGVRAYLGSLSQITDDLLLTSWSQHLLSPPLCQTEIIKSSLALAP